MGSLGFGGPIALAAAMHRDLVERRGWVSDAEYQEGLALAQLAPGPLAAQLAIYLGWIRAGAWGATVIALAFIGPSLLMVLALSMAYVRLGGMFWMRHAFYGIGAAVIAVIARSAWRLIRKTLDRDALLWALFAVSAVVTAWTGTEIVWLFALSGVIPVLWRARPGLRVPLIAPLWLVGLPALGPLATIFWYFAGASLMVFGSGLAIVPFLHGGVVTQHHWLTEQQFLDAVAVSMITPGPVVITVAFIGYLVGGLAGALLAAAGVFVPVYLVVIGLAPSFRRWAARPAVRAFVSGVTAAAIGAIAGAVFVLGRRAIVDLPTVVIAVGAFAVLTATRRIPEPVLIVAAGAIGVALG